jgi:hypothetical protein
VNCRALLAAVVALAPVEANAVCIHNGKFYAKTTLQQEYNEAQWVVRARVESARSHFGLPMSWTLYHMRLIHAFKGTPQLHFGFYTRRDSGGFYMDGPNGAPDVGHDYLLFLNPAELGAEDPALARGSLWVNYECGQSKAWREVTSRQRKQLKVLERRRW